MKEYVRANWLPLSAILLTTALIIAYYPQLPDRIPTHWGFDGRVNSYGAKWPFAFLGPLMGLAMLVLFAILPAVDPKRRNYQRFSKPYGILRDVLIAFSCFMGLIPIGIGLGLLKMDGRAILAAVGLLLAVMGNYMGLLKQNWYAGIKTPWTLSNETVWNKTHRFGGKLWVVAGAVSFVAAFIPKPIGTIIFASATVIAGVVPIAYSYVIYREESQKKRK